MNATPQPEPAEPSGSDAPTCSALQLCSQRVAGHIRKPMDIYAIVSEIDSDEYNAELMLQHLLLWAAQTERHLKDPHCVRAMALMGEINLPEQPNNRQIMNTPTNSEALPPTNCSSFCCPTEKCSITADGKCDALPRPACYATVTRYPTGYFGIDYQGSMFFWLGFSEAEAHAELERLCIPSQNVEWDERYYDRRYEFGDPRCYSTRKFIPHNAQVEARQQ